MLFFEIMKNQMREGIMNLGMKKNGLIIAAVAFVGAGLFSRPAKGDADLFDFQTPGSVRFHLAMAERGLLKKARMTAASLRDAAGRRLPRVPSFGLKFDSDVPPDIQAQLNGDLGFIQTIKGSGASSLHRQIFGAVDGPTYIRFFTSRAKSVGMSDCGDAHAVACVIPMEDPSKMWLTQNYIKFNHPQIARLMVVYHESRHTEVNHGNWPHADCPDPFLDSDGKEIKSIWTGASLAGEPACDTTAFGSYGSSLIMLKNVQKFCSDCTGKVTMDAGLYADDQFKRITGQQAHRQIQNDLYN
jgi:hypothetical protein